MAVLLAVLLAMSFFTGIAVTLAHARGLPDEAPAARAYLDAMQAAIQAMRQDRQTIADAAMVAADHYVAGGPLGVEGGAGLDMLLANRPGGLADYFGQAGKQITGEPHAVVLYAIGPYAGRLDPRQAAKADLDHIASMKAAGATVSVIASKAMLQQLGLLDDALAMAPNLIDTHAHADAAASDAPIHSVMTQVAAWAWQAELVAACTRAGRSPVLNVAADHRAAAARQRRMLGQRFHVDRQPEPIAPGALADAWLSDLGKQFTDVGTASWIPLASTAHRAADTIRQGGVAWLHVTPGPVANRTSGQLQHDPQSLAVWTAGDMAGPDRDDLLLVVGETQRANGLAWNNLAAMQQAGWIVWCLNAVDARPNDIGQHQTLLDQRGSAGDAVTSMPGYDVKFGPTSDILREAIVWMISVQTRADLQRNPNDWQQWHERKDRAPGHLQRPNNPRLPGNPRDDDQQDKPGVWGSKFNVAGDLPPRGLRSGDGSRPFAAARESSS